MTSSSQTTRNTRRLILVAIGLVALFLTYHLILRGLMLYTDLTLGAVGPGTKVYRLVPLYAYVDVHWKTGLLIAAAVLMLAGRSLWRLLERTTDGMMSETCLVARLTLWFLAVVVAVAMIDGGISRLWRPFRLLEDTDYIGGVKHVDSPRAFLREYAQILPILPDHCRTHPPGAVLFLWTVEKAVAGGPEAASVATILFAALGVPAVFLQSRDLLGRRRAILATFLFLTAPNVVLFTATCMDAVFFVFFAWTFYFLWSGRREHSWSFGILGGLAASLAAFFTFSAAILALWAVIVWLATLFLDRTHFASTTKTLFASAVAALCFYGILAACCGYHLIEVLQAAVDQHRAIMSGGGHETLRQHLHLTIANVVAFGFGSGVACVALPLTTPAFARENGDAADTANGGRRTVDLFAWCFAATLFLTAALPLYTLEVERIWLFFVPLLAISAVRRLDSNASDFRQLALTAFSLQAAQTGVMEVLLCTIW